MIMADGQGVPLGVEFASASPHKTTLVEPFLVRISLLRNRPGRPRHWFSRLIYDRVADSDLLRDRRDKQGIDLICLHCKNRKNPSDRMGESFVVTNDATSLSVLRTIGWMSSFR